MNDFIITFFIMLLMTMPVFAAEQSPDSVELKDHQVFHGVVLFWSDSQLYFDADNKGLIILSSSEIEKLHQVSKPAATQSSDTKTTT